MLVSSSSVVERSSSLMRLQLLVGRAQRLSRAVGLADRGPAAARCSPQDFAAPAPCRPGPFALASASACVGEAVVDLVEEHRQPALSSLRRGGPAGPAAPSCCTTIRPARRDSVARVAPAPLRPSAGRGRSPRAAPSRSSGSTTCSRCDDRLPAVQSQDSGWPPSTGGTTLWCWSITAAGGAFSSSSCAGETWSSDARRTAWVGTRAASDRQRHCRGAAAQAAAGRAIAALAR